jgi:NAD(P)H dehydrogenase (quinone)
MFRAARRREFAVTDPTLETAIGHPAASARSVLEAMISGH